MPLKAPSTLQDVETGHLDLHTLFEEKDEDVEFLGFDISPATENGNNNIPELISLFSVTDDEDEDFLGFLNGRSIFQNINLSSIFLDETNENEFLGF